MGGWMSVRGELQNRSVRYCYSSCYSVQPIQFVSLPPRPLTSLEDSPRVAKMSAMASPFRVPPLQDPNDPGPAVLSSEGLPRLDEQPGTHKASRKVSSNPT